jgi:hypothetical protein
MRPIAGLLKRVAGLALADLNFMVARAAERPIVPHGAGEGEP